MLGGLGRWGGGGDAFALVSEVKKRRRKPQVEIDSYDLGQRSLTFPVLSHSLGHQFQSKLRFQETDS